MTDLRYESRRRWLGRGVRGLIGLGGAAAWLGVGSRPSRAMFASFCPIALAGQGGGMYYYYCAYCPSNGQYGNMSSPTPLPTGCGSSACIPGAPSKQMPDPMAPRAAAASGESIGMLAVPDGFDPCDGLETVPAPFSVTFYSPFSAPQPLLRRAVLDGRTIGLELMRFVLQGPPTHILRVGLEVTGPQPNWPEVTLQAFSGCCYNAIIGNQVYNVILGRDTVQGAAGAGGSR
jgi:hypothetical protein